MKKKTLIFIVAILLAMSLFVLFNILSTPTVNYELSSQEGDRFTMNVEIENRNLFNRNHWIAVDSSETVNEDTEWRLFQENELELTPGTWYIHVKDDLGHTVDTPSILNRTLSVEIDYDSWPMYPIDQIIPLKLDVIKAGEGDPVEITSSDTNVASIINGNILCKAPGMTQITVSSGEITESFPIRVTDLYTLPEEDSSKKPFLKETICTEEEAHLLDEILERKIEEAGYGTRAGVVAAARFLALEFPYKLAYFSEGGRLDPASSNQVDGE